MDSSDGIYGNGNAGTNLFQEFQSSGRNSLFALCTENMACQNIRCPPLLRLSGFLYRMNGGSHLQAGKYVLLLIFLEHRQRKMQPATACLPSRLQKSMRDKQRCLSLFFLIVCLYLFPHTGKQLQILRLRQLLFPYK